jgi:MFS family permease
VNTSTGDNAPDDSGSAGSGNADRNRPGDSSDPADGNNADGSGSAADSTANGRGSAGRSKADHNRPGGTSSDPVEARKADSSGPARDIAADGGGSAGRLARYAVAATLARLSDEMVGVSLVLLVLDRTGSAALAGAAVAGYTLPAVLTGPLLGAWLSGARHPKVALAANELVLAAVAGGLVLTTGHTSPVVLVALTLVAGVSLPLTSGGFSSLLPALVGDVGMTGHDRLGRANTVDAATVNGAAIGGPALAGTLTATLGPGAAVFTVALVALLAAATTAAVPGHRRAVTARPALLSVARAGLLHLARTAPLRAATLTSVISYGSVGLLVVALPARVVALGADRAAVGYLWTAFELGGFVGILVLNRRLREKRPERVVYASVGAYGLLLGAIAVADSLVATLVLAVVAGFAEGPCLPAVFAARQRYSPGTLLAQVGTTGASLKIGAFALGSVLSGTLTGPLGAAGMVALAAAGQLVAAGAGWAAGRSADPTPDVTTGAGPLRTP